MENTPLPLSGEVAFVTGSGRGIGRAIAEGLARKGAVVAVAARSKTAIVEVSEQLSAEGHRVVPVECDVTDASSVDAAFAEATQRLGRVSLLVNNAGIQGPFGPVGSIDTNDWWETHKVHVYGALLCMTRALPEMVKAGKGRIINIASVAGTFVAVNASAYAVAKASVIRLTEHVDAERSASGIRAFALQPGTILTEMSARTLEDPAARQHAGQLVALLETVTTEESMAATAKLQEQVVRIASGHFDALSGRYLDASWDLDALLKEQTAKREDENLQSNAKR